MSTNRSYFTDGLDDPSQDWLTRKVLVKAHPEWGEARVLRWYPAAEGQGQRLRIMAAERSAPQIVSVLEVDVVES